MTDAAAIQGDYADFKIVRTRKVCQIVVEVPIERAGEVFERIGMPDPGGGKPCAIALIQASGVSKTGDGLVGAVVRDVDAAVHLRDDLSGVTDEMRGKSTADDRKPATKPKQRWGAMPPSQRAALLCQDTEFWEFLDTCGVARPYTAMAADTSLKHLCGIRSKTELDLSTGRFEALEGNFFAWRQAKQHGIV